MGLDYTTGCVNFRDVGEFLTLITGEEILPVHRLYRGGSIDHVKTHAEISEVKTVINLRNGEDYHAYEATYLHFPMANKVEKYDTSQKEVRRWLNAIMRTFEAQDLQYPILLHCLSGKDRTEIVTAALLMILGIDEQVIKEEYLLSDGEVQLAWIEQAMAGMRNLDRYFDRIDRDLIRRNLLDV